MTDCLEDEIMEIFERIVELAELLADPQPLLLVLFSSLDTFKFYNDKK